MKNVAQALAAIPESILAAEREFGRAPGSVSLLAVSKGHPADAIRAAADCGQRDFGENYLQEALAKMAQAGRPDLRWHFIGRIQSNKTRDVAAHFDWVHSVDRLRIASRLSEARPQGKPPLDVLIQVNIDDQPTKAGIPPEELPELAAGVAALPGLRLRGLMAMPAPATDLEAQRRPFRALRECFERLRAQGFELDTLSMGTTADLRAAVAEGATMVRVGTGVFGPRPQKPGT